MDETPNDRKDIKRFLIRIIRTQRGKTTNRIYAEGVLFSSGHVCVDKFTLRWPYVEGFNSWEEFIKRDFCYHRYWVIEWVKTAFPDQ